LNNCNRVLVVHLQLLCSARELLPPPLNSGELPWPPPAPAPLASATSTSSAPALPLARPWWPFFRATTPSPNAPWPPRHCRRPTPPCRASALLRVLKTLQYHVSHSFCLLPELKSPPVVFFLAPPPFFLRRHSASPSAASSRAPHPRSRPPPAPPHPPKAHSTDLFPIPPPERPVHVHAVVSPPPQLGFVVVPLLQCFPAPVKYTIGTTSSSRSSPGTSRLLSGPPATGTPPPSFQALPPPLSPPFRRYSPSPAQLRSPT
jgi:hypothetical protein